jgi:hypothetical protein
MKTIFAAALAMGLVAAASAETVRLANEPGGSIAGHIAKYQQLAARGVMVELSGTCTSACTMVTGIIPSSRLCARPGTVLRVHGGSFTSRRDGRAHNEYFTTEMEAHWSPALRAWAARRRSSV